MSQVNHYKILILYMHTVKNMIQINPKTIKIQMGIKYTNNVYLMDTKIFNNLYETHLKGVVFHKELNDKTEIRFISLNYEKKYLQIFEKEIKTIN